MKRDTMAPSLWLGQRLHLVSLALLLVIVYLTWIYLGKPAPVAFWSAVSLPIVHQIFVWLTWRLELRSAAISRSIGLRGYVAAFFVLFGGRFVSLFLLGWVDCDSLNFPSLPRTIVTTLLLLFGLYAMYSVSRYFGMVRAAGADHFDPKYREMPLVQDGIFRFTNNGMYIYAFLLFWAIAIGLNSVSALVVAGFSHAYIWVHFFATEKPDMDFLYKGP